jgi:uncharacterized protein (TIGR02246 family)
MPAKHPEDLDRLFEQHLNAGNLDGLMSLYEQQATLTPQPGQVVVGASAVREALQGFLAMKPTMKLDTKVLAHTGDLALMTSRWALAGTGPDGKPVQLAGESVEVVRRQMDATWLFAIDTPWGLEWS